MAKILSAQDGNLSSSIKVAVGNIYKDIDLSMAIFEDTGDVYKKNDAAAVRQSVSNILQCGAFDKPFAPDFGAGLQALLFDLTVGNSDFEIRERITRVLTKYEPRAILKSVKVETNEDNYSVNVRVEFGVRNFARTEVIDTTISGLR